MKHFCNKIPLHIIQNNGQMELLMRYQEVFWWKTLKKKNWKKVPLQFIDNESVLCQEIHCALFKKHEDIGTDVYWIPTLRNKALQILHFLGALLYSFIDKIHHFPKVTTFLNFMVIFTVISRCLYS
jgi:hypothetical protein